MGGGLVSIRELSDVRSTTALSFKQQQNWIHGGLSMSTRIGVS